MADEVIHNNKICSNEIFSIEKKIYILMIKKKNQSLIYYLIKIIMKRIKIK